MNKRSRGPSAAEGLPWLRWWAELLDSRFRIPGTSIRFGLDPVLSLIPGIGDLASPVFTVLLLVAALRWSVPKVVMLRMMGNALIDAFLGMVPIAGNVGDIFWRANTTNLALLERHAETFRRPSTGDYAFVFGVVAVFGLIIAIPVFVAIWIASLLWNRL